MYEVARGQVGCLLGRALRLAMHAMSHDGLILARRSKTVSQNLREVDGARQNLQIFGDQRSQRSRNTMMCCRKEDQTAEQSVQE